ncbi:resuscitation-promoting factor [Nocardioides insulae]|uniref:resuscitation-promoting factor n=1 Tax=Nocardioides insulae TaxID=394734 RepID=UPI0003F9578E|nr:resuscitation-promoting factor [Nocardioides insulae]
MPSSTPGPLSRLKNRKLVRPLVTGLVATAAVAVVGTTVGYQSLSTTATVSLDGEKQEVTAFGDTVGDVLDAEGVEIGDHDVVAPGLDEKVSDGSSITVRFARPVTLDVDGAEKTHWVTATSVNAALAEIGRSYDQADLSVSRSAGIGREGMDIDVVTPKTVTVKLAGAKPTKTTMTVATVGDALDQLGVKVEKRDEVRPAAGRELNDGDTIVFTDMRVAKKNVKGESIDFDTVERADDSAYEGEEETVREGREGARNVTYRLVYRNGEVVKETVLNQRVTREPVDEIVEVGTKEEPEEPAADYSGGSTVWDQLAQCEAGGNWAINTGNGYYGGLQFNIGTWQSYGGTGLPSENSREEQIRIAEKVRAATGGYGSWPACSSSLGLPQ